MEDYVVKLMVLSVVAWATLFLAMMRIVFPSRSFDFSNRLVSTAHALLAVVLASLSVRDWRCPVCPVASKSSPMQMQTLAVTVGYLTYDLICCQFDKQVKLDNTVHHLVSIIGLVAGLAYQRCGSEMVAALFITEVSSPFLHLRELLKELGYKGTDLNLTADHRIGGKSTSCALSYIYVDIEDLVLHSSSNFPRFYAGIKVAFAVIFSSARMIGGPYLTYVTLTAHNPFLIKAMAVGLQLVSAFWFYKIVRMIIYKFSARSQSLKTQKKLK